MHVRRPRVDYESQTTGLDRNEVGALHVAAGLGAPAEHALVSLLALNGLRVSKATRADIEAPAPHPGNHPQRRQESSHPSRPADRPRHRPADRRPLRRMGLHHPDRAAAGPGRPPRRPDQEDRPPHHEARLIIAALDVGVPLPDVQEAASHADPRTMRYDRARVSLDRHATYIVAASIAGAAR